MTFIIDPSSISPTSIESDLQDFIEAQPDAARWKDFFASSVGKQLTKIISGLGTFIVYNVITARRETYLPYASNRSSGVASSGTLGYSTYRGRNAVVELTISPNISSLIPKFSVIGTVKDKDLVILEDVVFNAGVQKTFLAVVGDRLEESLSAATEAPSSFRYSNNNMSQDLKVLLNDEEVQFSERILDLINEKFVIQSNVNGAVNLLYLNLDSFITRYTIGDELKIQYIELHNLSFTLDDIICDIGTIVNSTINSVFQPVETLENIKINAPLFHETQYIIRGRDDYMKIFRLLDSNIIDTSYTDVSAAVVQLTYVTDDLSLFTTFQLNEFITRLMTFRAMGLKPPTVKHPDIVFLNAAININLLNDSGNPSADVELIVSDKENKLQQTITFADLEKELEDLSFTKIARIALTSTPWLTKQFYVRGHFVTPTVPNGKIYEMLRFVCSSSSTEPAWGVDPIIDNNIIWCAEDKVVCVDDGIAAWSPNTVYSENDYVIAITAGFETKKFRACQLLHFSNSSLEMQQLTFSPIPLSGTFRLEYGAEATPDLPYNVSAAALQTALNSLSLTNVTVAGSHIAGFDITFGGVDANQDQPELTLNDAGQNEIQCFSFDFVPTSGSWAISFNGQNTGSIAHNASAAAVKTALESLININAGNLSITGSINPAKQLNIEFINDLEKSDQPQMTVFSNTLIAAVAVTPTPSTTTPGAAPTAGQNDIQQIEFSLLPTSGTFSLTYEATTTILLNKNDTNVTIEAALEALSSVGAGNVNVTGNFTSGFTIEFVSALGLGDRNPISVATNALIRAIPVTVSVSTTQNGGGGFNEIHKIDFNFIPNLGNWKLSSGAYSTPVMTYNTPFATLQSYLESMFIVLTGDTTIANNVITNIITTDVETGTIVTGLGIPVNTRVISKTVNTVTLSNNCTLTNTAVVLTFSRNNVGNVEVTGDYTNGFVVFYRGALTNLDVVQPTVSLNTLTIDQLIVITPSTVQEGISPTAGVSEVQRIDFNKVPDSGNWTINFNGDITAPIAFNDTNATIQTLLQALPSIGVGNVIVSGNYTAGFVLSFINALGLSNQPQVIINSNSLNNSTAPIVITPCTINAGRAPAMNLSPTTSATITTVEDGTNPEPDWFSGAPIC